MHMAGYIPVDVEVFDDETGRSVLAYLNGDSEIDGTWSGRIGEDQDEMRVSPPSETDRRALFTIPAGHIGDKYELFLDGVQIGGGYVWTDTTEHHPAWPLSERREALRTAYDHEDWGRLSDELLRVEVDF